MEREREKERENNAQNNSHFFQASQDTSLTAVSSSQLPSHNTFNCQTIHVYAAAELYEDVTQTVKKSYQHSTKPLCPKTRAVIETTHAQKVKLVNGAGHLHCPVGGVLPGHAGQGGDHQNQVPPLFELTKKMQRSKRGPIKNVYSKKRTVYIV